MPTLKPRRAKAAWPPCTRAEPPKLGTGRRLSRKFSGQRGLRERETPAGNASWKGYLERRDVGSGGMVAEQRLLAGEPVDCPTRALVAAGISGVVSGAGCAMAHRGRPAHSSRPA